MCAHAEVSAWVLQNESDAYRKIRLRVEDVQGKNCLTNFWVCYSARGICCASKVQMSMQSHESCACVIVHVTCLVGKCDKMFQQYETNELRH